jgi:tRNA 5-methylaminomethyl-2-thiouridine biosynthesis bifunctional protein
MSAEVEWREDGTPFSPRFGDIYRTRAGGLEQARHVFLDGCGLPAAWQGQAQWRILETGFGLALNFLAAWQAWRDDPARPRVLHYVAIEGFPATADDLVRSAEPYAELAPLARELAGHWWGMTAGVHRIALDQGQVLLTLCIGDIRAMLRELDFTADSLFLDGFAPDLNPDMWDLPVIKSLARLSRRGTRVASWTSVGEVRRALAQCGFAVERRAGLPPKRHCIAGEYAPAWTPRTPPRPKVEPGRCVVVGAGLAGAAVAASLARRGWRVDVLDAAPSPAAGASGLPAGLFAPHLSPDDALLSRLTRRGLRATLQAAQGLEVGRDWALSGVLEHRPDGGRPLHDAVRATLSPDWIGDDAAERAALVGLDASAAANWLPRAGWMQPGALVRAWLATPGVHLRSGVTVARLTRAASHEPWCLLDADGQTVASAPWVVLAAAHGCAALLRDSGLDAPVLQPVRGQVSYGVLADREASADAALCGATGAESADGCQSSAGLTPWPVNGHGHFIPHARLPDGRQAWLSGSTYDSGDADAAPRESDHAANLARLRVLLPEVAARLAPVFEDTRSAGGVQAWSGVRCASADRRPLVGAWKDGLWLCAALGSRGLSLAALCAELIAARLHAEPLPLERRLAASLDPARARCDAAGTARAGTASAAQPGAASAAHATPAA